MNNVEDDVSELNAANEEMNDVKQVYEPEIPLGLGWYA